MKLTDLTAGDTVIADGGFTCLAAGPHVVHHDPEVEARIGVPGSGLFIYCTGSDDATDPTGKQQHFLEGQENEDGELIGLSRPVPQ